MEVTGETCKLCLKYIQGDDLALLDETILGKLEFLQMDLDQSVEESNALCKECEEKIESAFDFKSCLVNTESCLVPYVSEDKTQKVNLRVILEKDTSSSGKGESSVEKEVCRLCKNFVKTNTVISLPKVLKDDTIMEVFQGHIPEMDLDVTENPMVCDSCHNSLASFSTLIASWSIANGWNEDDEDMKEDFEMVNVKNETLDGFSDSKTNSSASFLENSGSGPSNSKNGRIEIPKIKTEIDEISDSTSESVTVPKVIKKEECADEEDAVTTIDQDLQLKSEEVEIKDEDGSALEGQYDLSNNTGKTYNEEKKLSHSKSDLNMSGVRSNKYNEISEFKKMKHVGRNSVSKYSLNTDSLTHKNVSDLQKFTCTECNYRTHIKSRLNQHELVHKSIHEVRSFKCAECSFITKYKHILKEHVLLHKGLHDVQGFSCHICPYVTNNKYYLDQHELIHKKTLEMKTYKCMECSYLTKYKCHLKDHKLLHRNINEVQTFSCVSCSYTTKFKQTLKRHELIHKNIQELKTFKCSECSYVAKQKFNLNRHVLVHKSPDKVRMFKCSKCLFTTKYRTALRSHMKRHTME